MLKDSIQSIDAFDAALEKALAGVDVLVARGKVVEVIGGVIKVVGVAMRIGELCELRSRTNRPLGRAEVVGFSGQFSFLSPLGVIDELSGEVEVLPLGQTHRIACSDALLGRVLDGFGAPIDGRPIDGSQENDQLWRPVDASPPDPLSRRPVDEVFETGVRAIDSLLTVGVGQRIGVFAPPGVGKSTLLTQLARDAACDVTVVALVGERGREVGDYVRHSQANGTMDRTVIVAASADKPATERIKATQVATAIAEGFRDDGRRVLLIVDSLTRLARAQREVGLAIGEPPTRRGFPPSVFSQLPRLLERSGQGDTGSITAFYAVLTEGQDDDDPIAEEAKSILDGHFMLSRKLASAGHYPAIDVLASISRLMSGIVDRDARMLAQKTRAAMAKYVEVEMLLQIGEYERGLDEESDRAIDLNVPLREFLRQAEDEPRLTHEQTLERLAEIVLE